MKPGELTALNVTFPSKKIGNLSEFQGDEAAGKCVPVVVCKKNKSKHNMCDQKTGWGKCFCIMKRQISVFFFMAKLVIHKKRKLP